MAQTLLGTDPQARRKDLRSPTLSQLVRDRYLPHAQATKRSWKTDEYLLRIHILPCVGHFALDEITSERICDLITEMRSKGYAAATTNRIVALLGYIFNLVRRWNVAGVSVNPAAGIATAPEAHRQRFLSTEETKRLIASISEDQNQDAAQAIMLLLLTGARRSEITMAKWEHVDWEKRFLLVPMSKSGRPRIVPLNAAVFAVLKSIPRDPAALCVSDPPCLPVLSLGPHPVPCRTARCPAPRSSPLVRELPREPGRLALRGSGAAWTLRPG